MLQVEESPSFPEPEAPWPQPKREACYFYHSIAFPDGESIQGHWDFRGRFDQYIGHYAIAGKTVLDVGTATGFLAFSAEAAGATVSAMDCASHAEWECVPIAGALRRTDQAAWDVATAARIQAMKNGFWYAWHKLHSRVAVTYTPLTTLRWSPRQYDVVLAGALLEHLGNPVSAIEALAGVANEAVIIAFTPVIDSQELLMRAANDWSDPRYDYTWWTLSRGLYARVFANLGFDIRIVKSFATYCKSGSKEVERRTIIARRPSSLPAGVAPAAVAAPRSDMRPRKLRGGWRLIREGLRLRH